MSPKVTRSKFSTNLTIQHNARNDIVSHIGKQEKASLELNKSKLLETSNGNPMLNDKQKGQSLFVVFFNVVEEI